MTQSKSKLYALINQTNFPQRPVDASNTELLELAPAAGGLQYNTRVLARSVPGQGFVGDCELFYKRIDLDVVGQATLQADTFTTAQDVLDALNAQCNLWLDLADVQAFELPDLMDGEASLKLTAVPESWGWIGSLNLKLLKTLTSLPEMRVTDGALETYTPWTGISRTDYWLYRVVPWADTNDYSASLYDDSNWAIGQAPFSSATHNYGTGWPNYNTLITPSGKIWMRKHLVLEDLLPIQITLQADDIPTLWINDELQQLTPMGAWQHTVTYTPARKDVVIVLRVRDDLAPIYADLEASWAP